LFKKKNVFFYKKKKKIKLYNGWCKKSQNFKCKIWKNKKKKREIIKNNTEKTL